MITLGLDPSLTGFGWCIHDSSKVGPERVIARGHLATTKYDYFIHRYIEVRAFLLNLIHKYETDGSVAKYGPIKAIGVESPPFGELWSEGLYGLFLYVNEVAWIKRINVVFFDPTTLKFLVKINPKIIKGKMQKGDMVEMARADTGIATGKFDHNEADAYHIARFAARFFNLLDMNIQESDLTPAEQHVFCRTHVYSRGVKAGTESRKGLVYRENDRFYLYSEIAHRGAPIPDQKPDSKRSLHGRTKEDPGSQEVERTKRSNPRRNKGSDQKALQDRDSRASLRDKAPRPKR